MCSRFLLAFAVPAFLAFAMSAAAETPVVLALLDDAYVAHAPASDRWTIGSRELELTIGFNPDHALGLQQIANPMTGRTWDITPGADAGLTLAGNHIVLSSGSAPVSFVSAGAEADAHGVRLSFIFEHRALRLRVTRTYACYPGSPTIETWTQVDASDASGPVALSDLVGWRITMPVATVRWLGGLRGGTADNAEAGTFELASRELDPGERIEIGGKGRSTEDFVPFVLVDTGVDDLYGGIMWSGEWQIVFERLNDTDLRVTAQFPDTVTAVAPGKPVEVPHAFFGLASHPSIGESGALRQFILHGIRRGRPFQPLVTYNTWFAYGTTINQEVLTNEWDRAAAMGVELVVVDAGWYPGAGSTGDYDFDSGLGTWTVDADRFPDGLSALAEEAHGGGMKFGVWVEPERVALDTVDRPGLAREAWLATRDGSYGAQATGQICLAHPDARKWVFDHVVEIVEKSRADYLKWDKNGWLNCNRSGHGHGAADGNFAHVQALYGLLAELRQRYPDLLIENVSGGGNRLDFGMLAFSDVAWMDDRTVPSSHVRHNIEGLALAFPPAYLLSFVIDSENEPIRGGSDFPLVVRSRMPGVLGLTYRSEDFDDRLTEDLSREILRYKQFRDIVAGGNATLLSRQAPVDEDSWDVLQEVADEGRRAVIFAFKGSDRDGRLVVQPRGLLADVMYEVSSVDVGVLGVVPGDLLMKDGIELVHAGLSRAHVIALIAQPAR